MKNLMLIVMLFAACAAGLPAQDAAADQPRRGFVVSVGAGTASIWYGADVEAAFASAGSYGVTRVEIGLNAEAGFAATQDIYVVGALEGVATRLEDAYGYYIQMNCYLAGGGVRVYPFHTGLVLGVEGGVAEYVAVSNLGYSGTSAPGWGAAGIVAYDFGARPTGMSLVAGLRVLYLSAGASPVSAAVAFAQVSWK